MIDKQTLTSALIEAVEIVKGKHWERVVLGLHDQLEMGEEPNISVVAEMLNVPLARLLEQFSECAFEKTGTVIVPMMRMQ
jgi:hypothetical protein